MFSESEAPRQWLFRCTCRHLATTVNFFLIVACVLRWLRDRHLPRVLPRIYLPLMLYVPFLLSFLPSLNILLRSLKQHFRELFGDYNWTEPVESSLLLMYDGLALQVFVLTIDYRGCAQFQILLSDVSLRVKVEHGKWFLNVSQRWVKNFAPA